MSDRFQYAEILSFRKTGENFLNCLVSIANKGIDELEPFLNIDDKLEFFREPDNTYDPKAIVIKTTDGVKIGYVPEKDNVIFARLMDAGKLLFGRITSKKFEGKWLRMNIKIFLNE
jgi:hypothetical protein